MKLNLSDIMFDKNIRLLLIGQSKTSRTETTELYFADKVSSMLVISFDSPLMQDGYLRVNRWAKSKIVSEEFRHRPGWINRTGSFSAVFAFLFYAIQIISILKQERESCDISLGVANFSTLCITIASKLGFISGKIIYYCLDLYPAPPANLGGKVIHRIYSWSEKILVKTSSIVWDISPNIIDGRQLLLNIPATSYSVIEVPGGYPKSYLGEYPLSDRLPAAIGFIGTLSPNQGVQLAIETMPILAKNNPEVKLHIVGKGPYMEELKSLALKHNVSERVIFHGFLPEDEAFEVLRRCRFGLGIWTGDAEDTSTYADPGKPKLYALLGLPIIITKYTPLAIKVEECNSGIVIPYEKEAYINAASNLLNKNSVYQQVYNGLKDFKEFYLIDPILDKAVKDSNDVWQNQTSACT